jgi:hypothetical protein
METTFIEQHLTLACQRDKVADTHLLGVFSVKKAEFLHDLCQISYKFRQILWVHYCLPIRLDKMSGAHCSPAICLARILRELP